MKRLVFSAVLTGVVVCSAMSHGAEGDVAEWIGKLGSADSALQIEALEALEAMGPAAAGAVSALTKLLESDNPEVKAHAAETLGAIGKEAKPAARALASLVRDEDPMVRREAIEALQSIRPGPQVMLPILSGLLQDDDPVIRARILAALAERGADAMQLLIPALENEKTAYFACLVISEIGPQAKEAVPALVKLLDDESQGLRREAIMALAAIGPEARPAVAKLTELIDSPVNGAAAIYALGSIGGVSGETISKLVAKADGTNGSSRAVSAWALAKLHPGDQRFARKAAKVLVATLQSEDLHARLAAARGLASLNAPPEIVRPIMLEALETATEETVTMMLDALASLGPAIVPQLIEALKHKNARPYICHLLGELGPDAAPAVEALSKLVNDADPDVQTEAALAIAEIGSAAEAAVPALTKALESEGPVRFAAAYALGRIGPKAIEAKPALLALLEDDESTALISAWALAHIHPECPTCQAKALPVLVEGLSDDSPLFRREAASGICCFGAAAGSAVEVLQKAAKDPDESVRKAAAEALKAIK